MSENIARHSVQTAALMIMYTLVGTLLLVLAFFFTREPIAESERKAKLALLEQVLPASLHDNDLVADTVSLPPSEELGNRDTTLAYRARQGGQPTAVILEAVAPDGYSGDIKLLIGVRTNGEIAGVRALAHKETPGLGDYIEVAKSNWIKNFDGKSLAKLPEDGWKVKKDGGRFDHMAGATITPRAVVKAAHKALKYFAAHREQLFAAPAVKEPAT